MIPTGPTDEAVTIQNAALEEELGRL